VTSLSETFADLLQRAELAEDYWLDMAISDFSRELHARMEAMGVTHRELAKRMGTSRPYVTKLLSGGNFTLQTMVKLAMALDAVVRVRLEDRGKRAEQLPNPSTVGATVVNIATRLPGPIQVRTISDGTEPLAARGGVR
jgi:transcriptional regulator with XRE-family HTH domain